MRLSLLAFIILMPLLSVCQSFEWWRDNVNWDGQSHWSKYIIISPKYLGPNALTVPFINNGSIDSFSSAGITANAHFSKGDKTQNFVVYGNYTTKNNTISVDLQYVPYERFRMSHEVKTERQVYYKNYYDKHTVGDFVVNTTIQLFQKWRDKAQLALRLGFRMPAGRHMGAARYGDVPGYWIDMGGAFPLGNPNLNVIGMAGFYVWQTNVANFRQDDAVLFGGGFEWNKRDLKMQAYAAGYSGYKNNGDRPTLLRFALEKKIRKKVLIFRAQQGLHDFEYLSFEAGAKFILSK